MGVVGRGLAYTSAMCHVANREFILVGFFTMFIFNLFRCTSTEDVVHVGDFICNDSMLVYYYKAKCDFLGCHHVSSSSSVPMCAIE